MSFGNISLWFGSRLVNNLYNLGLDLWSHNILLSFHLSYENSTNFLSFNYGHLLGSLCTHFCLILFYLGPINCGLDFHHFSIVFTFHICHLLSLLIFHCQHLGAVLFDMILQLILKFCFFLKSLGKFRVNINISDTAVLKWNTEILKLGGQILDHFRCHFSLQIKNLT
jgi:hypothetical protein